MDVAIDRIIEFFGLALWFQPRAYRDTQEALEGMEGSDRLRMLELRAKTLPNSLSTHQVQKLIGPLEENDKVRALGVLVKKLARNARRTPLLEGLTGYDRTTAEKLLQK